MSGDSFDWDEANRDHLAAHDITPEKTEPVLLGFWPETSKDRWRARAAHWLWALTSHIAAIFRKALAQGFAQGHLVDHTGAAVLTTCGSTARPDRTVSARV